MVKGNLAATHGRLSVDDPVNPEVVFRKYDRFLAQVISPDAGFGAYLLV